MTAFSDPSGWPTSVGVGLISIAGAISKTTQWRDAATGKVVWPLLMGGIATCLIMASVVRAAGTHWGVEPWAQVMASGVLCYVGPDPILKAVASLILKRFGVEVSSADSAKKS